MKIVIKKHVADTITCANLFSGCVGIVLTFQGNLIFASYAIFLAALFDFFDGMAARLLKSHSAIGKDLDSLADIVSFGVLPSVIIYALYLQSPSPVPYLGFAAFLIAVFSAVRLAKFNNDIRQTDIFIGLPTPANALLIASLPFVIRQSARLHQFIIHPFVLTVFVLLMSFLLVAEIPLMSLKFKNTRFDQNIFRYLLILVSALLIVFFKFAAVPVVIFLYIALSIIQFKFTNDKVPG